MANTNHKSGRDHAFRILGIASSKRNNSYSTQALKITLQFAQKWNAETRILDLRSTNIPTYDPDADDYPGTDLAKASEDVNWADAFILSTPDYHGSMAGTLKNFLDHFWQEFSGKVFGYIVASHEKGLTVMDQMRTAVRQCYGWSLPYGVSINGDQDIAEGRVVNSRMEKRLEMLGRDMTVYGKIIRSQYLADLAGSESSTFAARFR